MIFTVQLHLDFHQNIHFKLSRFSALLNTYIHLFEGPNMQIRTGGFRNFQTQTVEKCLIYDAWWAGWWFEAHNGLERFQAHDLPDPSFVAHLHDWARDPKYLLLLFCCHRSYFKPMHDRDANDVKYCWPKDQLNAWLMIDWWSMKLTNQSGVTLPLTPFTAPHFINQLLIKTVLTCWCLSYKIPPT